MSVTILDHALIQHKLTIMRDKNTSTYIFKQNLRFILYNNSVYITHIIYYNIIFLGFC